MSASVIWGRTRFVADAIVRKLHPVGLGVDAKVRAWRNLQPVKGIYLVICGHTVIDDRVPRGRGNVLWIETGAVYGGRLTIMDPLARVLASRPRPCGAPQRPEHLSDASYS